MYFWLRAIRTDSKSKWDVLDRKVYICLSQLGNCNSAKAWMAPIRRQGNFSECPKDERMRDLLLVGSGNREPDEHLPKIGRLARIGQKKIPITGWEK
ncbi:MAG: hypothetical protein HYU30_05505 [Chloroflexi bacterium]|nr:hypothetical protein [Chloroflexota bacterium]